MTTTPTIPRSKTFETLRQSRNEAAVTTLAWGLSSLDGNLRRATLETLIKRPGWSANRAILPKSGLVYPCPRPVHPKEPNKCDSAL